MNKYEQIFNKACIVAPGRNQRPFIRKKDSLSCPFCLTHEESLEGIIQETWCNGELLVRIVPNLYPITSVQGAKGYHDVVIDTEHHTLHPKDFSFYHWEILLQTMQERWDRLMNDSNLRIIQIFKNYGTHAGASVSHSHWQIVALEKIPYSLQNSYVEFGSKGNHLCYLCDSSHIEEGYLIHEDNDWMLWVPPTPQFSYEVWMVPKHHYQHYGELSSDELSTLSKLIKNVLSAYHELYPGYDFNICMMSGDLQHMYPYHFHLKVMIRIGHVAGFEIATGCYVLSTAPHLYAEQIRNILKGMYQ